MKKSSNFEAELKKSVAHKEKRALGNHMTLCHEGLPLCFILDHFDYKGWLPLQFQYCLALKDEIPTIYESFMAGEYLLRHAKRKESVAPIDHALKRLIINQQMVISGLSA